MYCLWGPRTEDNHVCHIFPHLHQHIHSILLLPPPKHFNLLMIDFRGSKKPHIFPSMFARYRFRAAASANSRLCRGGQCAGELAIRVLGSSHYRADLAPTSPVDAPVFSCDHVPIFSPALHANVEGSERRTSHCFYNPRTTPQLQVGGIIVILRRKTSCTSEGRGTDTLPYIPCNSLKEK